MDFVFWILSFVCRYLHRRRLRGAMTEISALIVWNACVIMCAVEDEHEIKLGLSIE